MNNKKCFNFILQIDLLHKLNPFIYGFLKNIHTDLLADNIY